MNADGSDAVNLTNNVADDTRAAWSPDGLRIAWARNGEIFVMDSNGANQHNVTNNPDWDDDPAWSPDGAKIAFATFRDGDNEIYVIDDNGAKPAQREPEPRGRLESGLGAGRHANRFQLFPRRATVTTRSMS